MVRSKSRYENGVPKLDPRRQLRDLIYITPETLLKLNACLPKIELFKEVYKRGLEITRYVTPMFSAENRCKGFPVGWIMRKLHLTGCIAYWDCVEYLCRGSYVCEIEQSTRDGQECVISVSHRTGTINLVFGPNMELLKEEYTNETYLWDSDIHTPLYRRDEYIAKDKNRRKTND